MSDTKFPFISALEKTIQKHIEDNNLVEVVRCKECEFSSMPEWDSDEIYCTKHNNWFKLNGYCYLGKRKENEQKD